MKGFVISTENKMQFKDFNEPLLLSIGTEICGYSETVHPKYLPEGFCMVVNDEGFLRGLPLNRFASLLYGTPEHGQPIVGNAVILREGFVNGERDFVDMTDEDQMTLIMLMTSFGNVALKLESEAE